MASSRASGASPRIDAGQPRVGHFQAPRRGVLRRQRSRGDERAGGERRDAKERRDSHEHLIPWRAGTASLSAPPERAVNADRRRAPGSATVYCASPFPATVLPERQRPLTMPRPTLTRTGAPGGRPAGARRHRVRPAGLGRAGGGAGTGHEPRHGRHRDHLRPVRSGVAGARRAGARRRRHDRGRQRRLGDGQRRRRRAGLHATQRARADPGHRSRRRGASGPRGRRARAARRRRAARPGRPSPSG